LAVEFFLSRKVDSKSSFTEFIQDWDLFATKINELDIETLSIDRRLSKLAGSKFELEAH